MEMKEKCGKSRVISISEDFNRIPVKIGRGKNVKVATHLIKNLMDLLFPPVCAVCRVRIDIRQHRSFCSKCAEGITYLRQPVCRVCGMELAGGEDREYLCGECLRNPPSFSLARSLVRYEPAVRQLLQRLKYAGDTSVIPGLTALIRGGECFDFLDCDRIIPVPLHVERFRTRGLNQARLLAGLFFPEKKQVIHSNWLIRTRNTTAQTKLGGIARRKNMHDAFQVSRESKLEKKVICLVDDVFTTGTTVNECAKVLLQHGALDVKVLTLARVAVPRRGINW